MEAGSVPQGRANLCWILKCTCGLRTVIAKTGNTDKNDMRTNPRPVLSVLCVCRGGNTRSVAAKMIIHRHLGHDAIAIGVDNNSTETLHKLCKWADMVVVMSRKFEDRIPSGVYILIDVGDDIWGNPFHPELQCLIVDLLNATPALNFGRTISQDKVITGLRKYRDKIESRKDAFT